MPNRLTINARGKDGVNLADFFNDLEQGLYSTSGAGTELLGPEGTALMSSDAGTMEMRIDYVTIDGQVHATGFTLIADTLPIVRASFADPEPLGFPVWTDMLPSTFGEALLGDTQIDFRGGRGDDQVTGSDFGDRFTLGAGDDAAAGGAGNDILLGGRGNDLLVGGPGDDRLGGGQGNDLLISGPGNNQMDGGNGNDVLISTEGVTSSKGGRGVDLFVFDSFGPTAGADANVPRTVVRDFDTQDLLLFADLEGPFPTGAPEGATLADLETGPADEFQWRETNRGVEMLSGDAEVLLRGVTAEEILLSQLGFSTEDATDVAYHFDGTADGEVLGQTPGGDGYITFGTETTTFITFGEETGL